MNTSIDTYIQDSITLLKSLIETPSFSREEEATATLIYNFLDHQGLMPQRMGNNVWVKAPSTRENASTVLLNSHHDTVKPATGWKKDPYTAELTSDGQLFGLGSNDAGGPLVSMIAAFRALAYSPERPYHLIMAATAEEEISGANGIAALLPHLGPIEVGIVGEPKYQLT